MEVKVLINQVFEFDIEDIWESSLKEFISYNYSIDDLLENATVTEPWMKIHSFFDNTRLHTRPSRAFRGPWGFFLWKKTTIPLPEARGICCPVCWGWSFDRVAGNTRGSFHLPVNRQEERPRDADRAAFRHGGGGAVVQTHIPFWGEISIKEGSIWS